LLDKKIIYLIKKLVYIIFSPSKIICHFDNFT